MIRLHAVGRWTLLSTMVAGLVGGVLLGRAYLADDVVVLSFLAYAAVGAIITRERPDNAVGWIFLTIGALTGLASASGAVVEGIDSATLSSTQLLAVWFEHWFWFPLLMLATTFTVLLFPEGLPSRRWRPVLLAAIGSTSAFALLVMFQPTLTVLESQVDNPLSPFPATSQTTMESQPIATALLVIALLCGLAAVASIVIRFRRSRGVERAQLRWFALAVSLVAVALLTVDALGAALSLVLGEQTAEFVSSTLFASCLGFIPVACGIAITRHGLYEIDRVLSRTLAYALVTGVVLATYTLVVTSVSSLLPESNALAVAGATLAAAAAIRPVRRRVQDVVDRRFNRARFDAVREVDEFAARLRGATDARKTTADLVVAVQRTLAPASVGLWTRGPES